MKFVKIEGIIEMPDDLNTDNFIDAYIEFIESYKCYFGGGFEDVTTQEKAHKYCANHKEKLLKDKLCGCFHCLKIFAPTEITRWLDEDSGTALCPYCGIDSVIGESAGYPITKEFLKELKTYWFK